jgi:hypothetical protein
MKGWEKNSKADLEVGQIYGCFHCHVLLFPDMDSIREFEKERAGKTSAGLNSFTMRLNSNYWTAKLRKPVKLMPLATLFLVLNKENSYIEVLYGETKGWFINGDWLTLQLETNGKNY